MEDEIDIEEHDVLDNPRIRTIFPDLAQIKQETPENEYQEPDQEMDYRPYPENEDNSNQDDDTEHTRFESKIILGSKPTQPQTGKKVKNTGTIPIFGRKSLEIKQEVEEFEEIDTAHHGEHEEYHPSTVLILGSKPSNSGVIEPLRASDISEHVKSKTNNFEPETDLNSKDDNLNESNEETDPKDPTTAFVLVDNWGPRLQNSPCYCKECEILFPTRNTLLSHNMTAHSFLVAVDNNRAKKSTAKPSEKNFDAGKFCNHCNKIFPDKDSLINHLYETLTFDKNTSFKPQTKKVASNTSKVNLQKQQVGISKANTCVNKDDKYGSKVDGAANMYCCEICSFYCEIYGFFLKHMQNNHGINTAVKEKVVFTGVCLYCNAKMKTKVTYNHHIKLMHLDVFNSKGPFPKAQFAKKLTGKKQEANPVPKGFNQVSTMPTKSKAQLKKNFKDQYNSHKFQCQLCSEILLNYDQARRHRRLTHPESASQNIFRKITNFGNKTVCIQKARVPAKIMLKYPIKAQKRPMAPQAESGTSKVVAIPKSNLFKCNKCNLHYTSCTATVLHAKTCTQQKGEWRCDICKREFQDFDETVHRRQHQVSNVFNVTVYTENIYGKILNQCPKCNVYFHEKDYYIHEQKSICKGAGVKCEHCTYPIHPSSAETHRKWHDRVEFSKKDVILVKFENLTIGHNASQPVKRTLDSPNITPAKKTKMDNPTVKVYYCNNCGVCLFRYQEKHILGNCKNDPKTKNKMVCKHCGLLYNGRNGKSHTPFHLANPEITLMDMKFVSLKDKKVILPPIPDYPRCEKCEVHFGKQETVVTHNCKDSYKTCLCCQKRFSDFAYKLHIRFHEYHTRIRRSKGIVNSKEPAPSTLAKKPKMDVQLPELLQKYEMLTNTWDILFSCATCDIVCDSYDKVVEHCQRHFNNLESYDVIVQHCDICKLNFDGTSYERHLELHAQNKSVGKGSFTIQPYKYYLLFSQNWMKQFKNIPQYQMDQILSRSLYRYGRSVKLRVVKQGPPENAVFRCEKCTMYIHPQSLPNHYKNVSCQNKLRQIFKCLICGLPFSSLPGRLHHEKMHKTTKTFMVVNFNEDGDDEFNEKLRENDKKPNALGPTVAGSGKAYHYYRCVQCKVCIGQKEKAIKHKCSVKLVDRCYICQLHFHRTLLSRHIKIHELNPRFVRKNIKCTPFKNKRSGEFEIVHEEEEKPLVKLYKCQCELHFTSIKAADKHFEVCDSDIDIVKEKCSKCDRLFDTTQLVTHLCKHHSSDDEPTEFEVITVAPNKAKPQASAKAVTAKFFIANSNVDVKRKSLYKCTKCNVYYLSPGGLFYHFESNHPLSKVRPCPFCKLNFMPLTLHKHIKLQHQDLQCTLKDFIIHIGTLGKDGQLMIKNVDAQKDQKVSEVQLEVDKNKYQCKTNVSQDTQRDKKMTIYSKNLYKCEVCNAHFLTLMGLKSHIYKNQLKHEPILTSCPDCDYTFCRVSFFTHQRVHHRKMNLKRDDFKIVYNMPGARKSKETDQESDDSSDNSVGDTTSLNESVDRVNARVALADETVDDMDSVKTYKYSSVMFKCGFCDWTSFTNNIDAHIKSHVENKAAVPTACFCGLEFSRTNLLKHELLHHEKESLSRDDLYVITLSLHDDIIGGKHIFRCGTCHVYFMKLSALENHFTFVEHNTQAKECLKCGLTFQRASLTTHVKLHHIIMNLDRKDFILVESVGKTRVKIVELGEDLREKKLRLETAENDNHAGVLSQALPKYKATLHKCSSCETHYLTASNLYLHLNTCPLETDLKVICEECQLQFSKHNLDNHKEKHHKNMHLKAEDFEILHFDEKEVYSINKVVTEPTEAEDGINTLSDTEQIVISKEEVMQLDDCHISLDSAITEASEGMVLKYDNDEESDGTLLEDINNITEIDNGIELVVKNKVNEKDCHMPLDSAINEASEGMVLKYDNDVESDITLLGDIKNIQEIDSGIELVAKNMVHEKETITLTETPDSLDKHGRHEGKTSIHTESSSNASAKKDSDTVIKLYKCAVCNVCFLSQISCYKHATKHVVLDPKDYIECKLCGYQFLILNNSLHKHITKHHKKTFNPEDVLIEEYHPDILCHGTPKINIYFGFDKLQSKLISTTCEANVSSELNSDKEAKTDNVSSVSIDTARSVKLDDIVLET